jgi:transcriptional regulator with XRE-family HTH domain
MNHALSKLPKQTFGNLIQLEREKQGLSHRDIAVRCGVEREVVKTWERDEAIPGRLEMKKLLGSMQRLKHYMHLLPAERHDQTLEDHKECYGVDAPEQLAPIAPPLPPPPKTFGEALKRLRVHEGLSQEELGEMMKVTGQAISAWENGHVVPILDHYKMLLDLIPDLKHAPSPKSDFRDIGKVSPPGRPAGGSGFSVKEIVAIFPDLAEPEDEFDTGTLALSLEPPTKEKKTMQRSPVSPPSSQPISRNQPKPEPPKSADAPVNNDMRYALIRWGRLVHALRSREDAHVFTDFLAEASDAGMTLKDVIEALGEP